MAELYQCRSPAVDIYGKREKSGTTAHVAIKTVCKRYVLQPSASRRT